jgi:multisubunit Na+/H+ antiporter MnhF subunit
MKTPSAPNKIVWIIGLICGLLGIIGHYTQIQFLSEHNYLLLLVGFIALAIGTTFRGI